MKKIILFYCLFSSTLIFACKCANQSFGENFAQNDFVAEIEILKTYNVDFKTDDEDRFYKADIKVLKLYKGKAISSILIRGKIGEIYGPACEVEINGGEKFLVYLNTKSDFGMSSCTPRRYLMDKKIEVERKAIDCLLKNEITNTNCFYFSDEFFNQFKNLVPKNEFAVYRLKVNSKSKIASISVIQDFGTDEDEYIRAAIMQNFEVLKNPMEEIKNEEVYIVLFFNKDDEYIISNFI